ncbi:MULTISPECIES: hypothetical protein [Celeribacter]|jgi:hypothetical protein|uniref:Uncharacterized protein n=1 Tax=Celeribacter halophilus TaxID=576117 RepID=A0A1I3RMH3_9RHOB|nr:hypothetical protein [Celeribacter halophilus]MBU2891253.1 hypothetical protein [Celeribacter halophilus]MDO6456582.1 hypothetical protein [Celeribacter halophilus]MDO6510860.1 hypothetical protein [Celeribacter halophilus]MDO6723045.1 hypothetical protein [Celeribacter halophilus]PZX12690.1 hypothetical protein LX82_01433 [Celeribacter halophilus]
MEAPFDATSWDGITGAIYAGYGSVEGLWLLLVLAMVVTAIVFGWKHEEHAYKATEKKD